VGTLEALFGTLGLSLEMLRALAGTLGKGRERLEPEVETPGTLFHRRASRLWMGKVPA
jgi:hypothetical protein